MFTCRLCSKEYGRSCSIQCENCLKHEIRTYFSATEHFNVYFEIFDERYLIKLDFIENKTKVILLAPMNEDSDIVLRVSHTNFSAHNIKRKIQNLLTFA